MASKEELAKLTVAELKAQLKEAGLAQTGKKEELIDRLLASKPVDGPKDSKDVAAAPDEQAAASNPADASADPGQSANGAHTASETADDAKAADDSKEGSADPGKHSKIVFSDALAAKQAPQKITVVKPEQPAQPVVKSEAERLKERADRFKDPEVEKAKQRAARFGLTHPDIEKEKALKRAERFGTFNPDLEAEKKKARAARFGVEDPAAKAAARAERFKPLPSSAAVGVVKGSGVIGSADADFEAKKAARAARFAGAQ